MKLIWTGSFRKVKQLIHWGPLFTLTIIFTIAWTGLYCDLMWWPLDTPGGILHVIVYLSWLMLILHSYFKAAFVGPGLVPLKWQPEKKEDAKFLQYCKVCEGYKSPRSHHCRRCNRCVMKMDHHCPWINTCCGHFNHAYFTSFLFFAPLGCMHAAIILIISLYRSLHVHYYIWRGMDVPLVYLDILPFILVLFSIGLSIGVSISVGALFYIQIKSILKNETGIESWIITKAEHRRLGIEDDFIYPYNLGWKRNFLEVFTWSGRPRSDGFTWTVHPLCDQLTFTREQLSQKSDKRERAIPFTVAESYNATFIPLCKGCRVLFTTPCMDEPRLRLATGDTVLVTRQRRHWLYGEKLQDQTLPEQRGWFPRRCVIQLDEDEIIHDKTD